MFEPALLRLGVGLAVLRPGLEAGEVEAVHQRVDAVERVAHAELLLEDASGVLPAQRADTIGIGGPGEHALLERLVPGRVELGRPAAARLVAQGIQAVVSVGVAPALDEPAGAFDVQRNLWRGQAFGGQQDAACPVAGLGVAFVPDPSLQGGEVAVVMKSDVDGGLLAGGGPSSSKTPCGATEQAPNARQNFWGCV